MRLRSKLRLDSRYLDLGLESTGGDPLFTRRFISEYIIINGELFISNNPTQSFTTKMIGCRRCPSS